MGIHGWSTAAIRCQCSTFIQLFWLKDLTGCVQTEHQARGVQSGNVARPLSGALWPKA